MERPSAPALLILLPVAWRAAPSPGADAARDDRANQDANLFARGTVHHLPNGSPWLWVVVFVSFVVVVVVETVASRLHSNLVARRYAKRELNASVARVTVLLRRLPRCVTSAPRVLETALGRAFPGRVHAVIVPRDGREATLRRRAQLAKRRLRVARRKFSRGGSAFGGGSSGGDGFGSGGVGVGTPSGTPIGTPIGTPGASSAPNDRARMEISRLVRDVSGAFYTLVPIRPRWRGERRSLRTFAGVSLLPLLAFNPCPRRLSTPTDAFQLHPDVRSYGTVLSRGGRARGVQTPPRARCPEPRVRVRRVQGQEDRGRRAGGADADGSRRRRLVSESGGRGDRRRRRGGGPRVDRPSS